MGRMLGSLLAGYAARRFLGCGCFGTIMVIVLVYWLLG
jgi:hypothetical protein